MLRAWFLASGVMTLCIVIYFGALRFLGGEHILFLGYGIPIIGAAVAAFLAPQNKFNVGAATFIPSILVAAIGNYIAGELGFGDSIGLQGITIGMALSAPLIALASVCGALFGEWVSKGRVHA